MSSKTIDQAILEIIGSEQVRDQRSLLSSLQNREFPINQSTLSRHLKKLNIRKRDGIYHYQGDSTSDLAGFHSVLKVVMVPPNLLVVKTLPGHANAVSWHLDKRKLDGVEGTVAGDDNVFIAVRPPEVLKQLRHEIALVFNIEES